MVRERTGASQFQDSESSSTAPWTSSRYRFVGAAVPFWRLMVFRDGDRTAIWMVVAFIPCFRSRNATRSARRRTPASISSRPDRSRRKVRPFPTDLGGGCSPAGRTGL